MALRLSSLRTRLIVAYTGLIILGFGGLALLSGSQLSTAVRMDYEQQLNSETNLIAQGVAQYLLDNTQGQITQSEIDGALATYQTRIDGTISFTADTRPAPPSDGNNPPPSRPGNNSPPGNGNNGSLGNRQAQANAVDQRDGYLITTAPIMVNGDMIGRLEMRVPNSSLDNAVLQRWIELGIGLLVLALLSISASVWLSNTLIRPLRVLRQSALRLSQGDFSQRIAYNGIDEVSDVVSAFNEMAAQVESMLEEQRAFASNTSHELRTPLTTIRLRTEALRDDTTLDAETQQQYIAEVDDEVRRLSSLISDLTLLSRLDAGRAELGSEEIDFRRFAEQVVRQIIPEAQQNWTQVNLISPPTPITIRGSLTHLTVLFRNLLDNAIKYSPTNSQIEWRIEREGDQVVSRISDNGRGIPPEHLAHVFERFYRADKARSREIPGTGLGLALVKSIVDAYRGSIRIESAGSDRGTTVYVTLPII